MSVSKELHKERFVAYLKKHEAGRFQSYLDVHGRSASSTLRLLILATADGRIDVEELARQQPRERILEFLGGKGTV